MYQCNDIGESGDLAFGSVGSIDFLMAQNCNKILKKSGDLNVSNAHFKTKFHGITTNGLGMKNKINFLP